MVERKLSAKVILAILGGILVILLVLLMVLPGLNNLFKVTVQEQPAVPVVQLVMPDKPEPIPVTVYYIMEENSKKISGLYIEVFQSKAGKVFYMEIPTDTKVDLSEELYKSLQTYGPELPQHLTIANMAESFSDEYGLTAGNRILSEVLGVSLKEYVRTTADEFDIWMELQKEENTDPAFFETYSEWISNTTSSRTAEERWTYYESRLQITEVITEISPGSREKDGYRISFKRAKERLEEMRKGTVSALKQQEK